VVSLEHREKSEKAKKREEKKAEKKAKKAEIKGQKNPEGGADGAEDGGSASGPDVAQGRYGDAPMNMSREKPKNKAFIDVKVLSPKLANQSVWLRARLHTSRATGQSCRPYLCIR
jgi:hypothetical protein